jgi:hypothetical protein
MVEGPALIIAASTAADAANRNSRIVNEDFIDATLTSLKIIGKLQENDRLSIRNGQLCLEPCHKSGVIRALTRWMHGDSRHVTLSHIKRVISNVMSIDELSMMLRDGTPPSHEAQWTLTQMSKELEAAGTGLAHLKATYSDDSMMQANLEVLIERLVDHRDKVIKFLSLHVVVNHDHKP